MKNRSKCLFMCLLLLFVMNGSGVYAAAIKTNVPDERLEAGIYTSQDGEYTVKIPYLRQPDARIEERQITPQSDAIVFADYAGSVFSVVRMDNSETQSTVDEIAAIYKVAGLLIQKEIIATHRGQELRLLYVEEGGSPLITRTRVSGRWVESGMDLYQAGTIFIVKDVIYEAFAGVTPYVPPHLMKTAQSRDELFARAELNLLKFINGLSIKSQEIVDELNVEKELIAKKESELHAKLAPQAKDTGVKPAFNLWYLAGDISLPMYFKKVWYRPAKLGFSLKAYSKSGSLRVSEDAIDFDSRKKKIHIPVSAIESIRYGRIGMDAANFWVTIKYTTSNEESIASFKDGSKLGHGPDTELIYATVWQVANPSLDGPRELEPDQESELDDGLKALVNGDYTRALQILRPLAEQDNVDAQVIIGMMYSNGSGVELSISESIKWYQKAAESGDTEAQTKLGMMYVNGEGVAVDYAEAVKWFSMAAAAGDSQGLYHLGVAYYTGQGIEKNESKAAELFRQSAEQGHTWAQSNLARCYITGVGVVADNVHAYKWSLVARDQGDEPALEYIDYLMTVMTTEEKRSGRELAEAFEPTPSPADQKLDRREQKLALLKEGGHTQVIETPTAGMVQEQVVPPLFDEPSIEVTGSDDAEILEAVDAAVSVAKNHGFEYDASDSENGRVVVLALWKDRPVTLTMRFFRKESGLYIASAMEQPGDVFLSGGGKKIEQIFYPDLLQETTRRGLTIYGDAQATP